MGTAFTRQIAVRVKLPVHEWLQARKSPLNPKGEVSREVNLILETLFTQETAALISGPRVSDAQKKKGARNPRRAGTQSRRRTTAN